MTSSLQDFRASLQDAQPEASLQPALAALWWAHRGKWSAAHEIVQNADGPDAAWVHAYLHRVEGDASNAGYWYRRAGRPAEAGPLEQEWEAITAALAADASR